MVFPYALQLDDPARNAPQWILTTERGSALAAREIAHFLRETALFR